MDIAGFLQEVTVQVVPRPPARPAGGEGNFSWEPSGSYQHHTICLAHSMTATGRNTSSSQALAWGSFFFFFFLTPQMKEKFIPLQGKRQILASLSDYLFTGQ